MTKKQTKAKEPVTIRFKKLANGSQSIYLDIYRNGKRSYRFLKLYLTPGNSPFDKAQNANSLQAAQVIKSDIIKEIANEEAGIFTEKKVLLSDYWNDIVERRRKSCGTEGTLLAYRSALRKILAYDGDMLLSRIDRNYLIGLQGYLAEHCSNGTPREYFNKLNTILNCAYKDNLIKFNPITKLDKSERLKGRNKEIDYLTEEEIHKLMDTPTRGIFDTRNAYLFDCYVGLRISDIRKLTWGDIVEGDDGRARIRGVSKKTNEPFYNLIPIPAMKYLPARGRDFEPVFMLPSETSINAFLKSWARRAGISKNLHFHVGRHTNGTLLLSKGADLYTVSKLLGHASIRTTQVYAKVIDKKKDEASDLLNTL